MPSIPLRKGSWRIPIGQTYRRKWVFLDLNRSPHTKIAGITGSGKSECMKSLLYCLCNMHDPKHLHIYIIDLKGGATFAPFRRLPHVRGVYRTTEGALLALSEVQEEMWRRLEIIEHARVRLKEPPCFPTIILLIDEGGELSPADAIDTPTRKEKSMRSECMNILSSLVRIGREPGVRVVYGTQRPDKTTLPMPIRSQLENTLCFRVREHYDSEIVLGHEGAEKLPKIPGRMIFQSIDGELMVQVLYLPDDVLTDWLRSYPEPDTLEREWSRTYPNMLETSSGSTSGLFDLELYDVRGDE